MVSLVLIGGLISTRTHAVSTTKWSSGVGSQPELYRARVLDRIWLGIVISDRAYVSMGEDHIGFYDKNKLLISTVSYSEVDSLTRTPLFLAIHGSEGCIRLNAWPKKTFQQQLMGKADVPFRHRFRIRKCRTIHPLVQGRAH